MYQYSSTGRPISIHILIKALKRLGDLLQQENKRLELVCCGGIISLMHFHSRAMTQDVDAIFPANPANKQLLIKLIKQVGEELGLATDEKSLWFNDSVSFFGLETKSNVVIFHHPYLVLKAAVWEELLAHKVHASRHDKDIQDAVLLLKEIKGKDKERIYEAVKRYAPFAPHVPEPLLRKRFDRVWSLAFGS
ncbi:hypothetical protein [uncultured Microbulbifer sp.]|uniref:hypothetical protein n=1 Tax=uncultured Microbulbifer sp. TaxID=348147 RepID=UPI00260B57E8|nr:hypothetical protein [uncultured Microbulbifer sp.]